MVANPIASVFYALQVVQMINDIAQAVHELPFSTAHL